MRPEKLTQINEYFGKTIRIKEFAKYMRRLNHVIISQHLQDNDAMHKEWIAEGHFWLNNFLETIDPNLED